LAWLSTGERDLPAEASVA